MRNVCCNTDLLHRRQVRQLEPLKSIHTILRHAQVQRIRLLHLLELRHARQHILDGVQTVCTALGVLGEVGVVLDEALEVRHELVNRVLHMPVPVLHPQLVLFRDLNVLFFLPRRAFIDDGPVRGLVAFADGQQIERHGLVGEFME